MELESVQLNGCRIGIDSGWLRGGFVHTGYDRVAAVYQAGELRMMIGDVKGA